MDVEKSITSFNRIVILNELHCNNIGKKMDTSLLSPCGVYCGNCAVYKKGKCLGCSEESKKAETTEKVFCDIYSCAKNKKLATCSDCDSYPCEKYDKGIFAGSFVKWIREKLKEP